MSWEQIVEYSAKQMVERGISVIQMMEMERALWWTEGGVTGSNLPFGQWLGAIGVGAIPVAWQAYVFVSLGAPYQEARELLKAQETSTGFAQGFVMAILGWEWRHVLSLFYSHGVVRINVWDEDQNAMRVKNYNLGLIGGFLAGRSVPKDQRQSVVSALRKAAGNPSKGSWTRNDQISFVIPLAAAFSKRLMK